MCEIRSCDGSWTDSCEATEPYVLAMLSDQDPADVVGYAGALRSAENGSEEAEHNQLLELCANYAMGLVLSELS